MKHFYSVLLFVLAVVVAACFFACGDGGAENGKIKYYVPEDGGYEKIDENTFENRYKNLSESKDGTDFEDNTDFEEHDDESQNNLKKALKDDDKNSQKDVGADNSEDKPHVGRFDLASFKAGKGELKERFEYFYVQLRADDTIIVSFKEKEKPRAYLETGYRLCADKITIDSIAEKALTDISLRYAGEEIKITTEKEEVEITFVREISK